MGLNMCLFHCPSPVAIYLIGLGQEIINQTCEPAGMFNLCPVATTTKDVKLCPVDPLGQCQGCLQRNHFVLTPMNHQGFVAESADVIFRAGQVIPPALARMNESNMTEE